MAKLRRRRTRLVGKHHDQRSAVGQAPPRRPVGERHVPDIVLIGPDSSKENPGGGRVGISTLFQAIVARSPDQTKSWVDLITIQ